MGSAEVTTVWLLLCALGMLKEQQDKQLKQENLEKQEKEEDEQSAQNAIRVVEPGSVPVEISTICERLRPVTHRPFGQTRHYIPPEIRDQIDALRASWKPS